MGSKHYPYPCSGNVISPLLLPPACPPMFSLYRGASFSGSASGRRVEQRWLFPYTHLRTAQHVCHGRPTKKEKEAAAEVALRASESRPWLLEIPKMDEILIDPAWPEKVRNWSTFWSLFLNWVEGWGNLLLLERGDAEEMTMSPESLAWLQLKPEDIKKIEEVIDAVVGRVPNLQMSGYPVPQSIPGKKPWHVGHWKLQFLQDHMGRTQWEKSDIVGLEQMWRLPEADQMPSAPRMAPIGAQWDNWDAWDLRVFMEKKRAHRRQQADFARRQAEVGRWDYLTVSPLTDARMAKDSPFYPSMPRDPTHEECMERVRMFGKAVDPETIGLKILDPKERADAFEAGVHAVPDTLDFLRSIGHLTENEEDLIGPREDDVPSATMEEEFSENDNDPLDGTFDNNEEEDVGLDEEDDFGTADADEEDMD